MKRSVAIIGFIAAMLISLGVGGCSDGIDLSNDSPGEIETDLTDPEAVIQAHARAWAEQNFAAHEALLDPVFEFYPLEEDLEELFSGPWGIESWGRTAELSIANNMFDDNYSRGNGAAQLIEMQLTTESVDAQDERVEIMTTAVGRVMWSATGGVMFNTRLKLELVRRNGFFRIGAIHEIPIEGKSDSDLEVSSWGRTKGQFR